MTRATIARRVDAVGDELRRRTPHAGHAWAEAFARMPADVGDSLDALELGHLSEGITADADVRLRERYPALDAYADALAELPMPPEGTPDDSLAWHVPVPRPDAAVLAEADRALAELDPDHPDLPERIVAVAALYAAHLALAFANRRPT
jgi:hypothetical protein